MQNTAPPQSSGRRWLWLIPVGCLLPVVVCGGFITVIVMAVFGAIKSSGAYTESLAAVQNSPPAQEALGQPIEPDFLVSGNIETSGSSGHADISYNVSGPNGSGTVYAVADKEAGQWKFTTLDLAVDGGERIDLRGE